MFFFNVKLLGGFKNDKRHGDGIYYRKEDTTLWQQKWKNGQILSQFKLSEAGEYLPDGFLNDYSKIFYEMQR